MTDEMEYMNISQYCLNLIKNNLKLFFESKYKTLIKEEYKSSTDSFFDVMFYLTFLKNNINQIKEIPNIIINTVHSIKIFRNKIAHQIPVTLREFYRFVDDTQIIIESLNISDKNEIIKIENTRKEIIRRMNITDDNKIIIGTNYNAGNNSNFNNNDLNLNKINQISSDSDIEMGDYDFDIINEKKINYNEINGKNYNNFDQIQNNIQNNGKNNFINDCRNNNENENKEFKEKIDKDEKERRKKIDKNFEEIMKNNNQNKFMTVKKVEF